MSIYNGFSTRRQETSYNKNLYSLIFLVQHTLSKILNSNINLGDVFEDKVFSNYFKKIYEKVTRDEQYKYLPPKYGMAFIDLANFYGLDTEVNKEMKYIEDINANNSHSAERINDGSNRTYKIEPILEKNELEIEFKFKLTDTNPNKAFHDQSQNEYKGEVAKIQKSRSSLSNENKTNYSNSSKNTYKYGGVPDHIHEMRKTSMTLQNSASKNDSKEISDIQQRLAKSRIGSRSFGFNAREKTPMQQRNQPSYIVPQSNHKNTRQNHKELMAAVNHNNSYSIQEESQFFTSEKLQSEEDFEEEPGYPLIKTRIINQSNLDLIEEIPRRK